MATIPVAMVTQDMDGTPPHRMALLRPQVAIMEVGGLTIMTKAVTRAQVASPWFQRLTRLLTRRLTRRRTRR